MNILCYLWPLLAGLICGLLGYLLGKSLVSSWKDKVRKLEADLAACKKSKSTSDDSALRDKIASLEASLKACNEAKLSGGANLGAASLAATSLVAFDADAAKAVFGKKIKENDLTIVEGIGPKIQELFHNSNVKTWLELANTSVEKCQEVLDGGGSRFTMHNPDTWPKQAGLAADGKWQELKDWQDVLDGGR